MENKLQILNNTIYQEKPTPQIFHINDTKTNEEKFGFFKDNTIQLAKYNLVTFLPKALAFQFTRLANVYFLIIAVFQSIPLISPLTPVTAVGPLIFVLIASLIREGWEDKKRHDYDDQLNNEPVNIYDIQNDSWIEVKSKEIRIGQLVVIKDEDVIPADIIILDSNKGEGHCFVETSNLDGEKTLKKRVPNSSTIGILNNRGDYMKKGLIIAGEVVCDAPNSELYKFDGKADLIFNNQSKTLSYNQKNILLKGSRLKNTQWVIGFVCYVGHDGKLIKNTRSAKNKLSVIENLVSKLVVYIIYSQAVFCISSAILQIIFYNKNVRDNPFLPYLVTSVVGDGIIAYFTYLMLLNTMVPISLIITLEIVKIFQGYFMTVDAGLYCTKKRIFPKIGSVSINEELGQVTHIFSDKTGTLTNNKMKFRYCVIGDTAYEMNSKENFNPLKAQTHKKPKIQNNYPINTNDNDNNNKIESSTEKNKLNFINPKSIDDSHNLESVVNSNIKMLNYEEEKNGGADPVFSKLNKKSNKDIVNCNPHISYNNSNKNVCETDSNRINSNSQRNDILNLNKEDIYNNYNVNTSNNNKNNAYRSNFLNNIKNQPHSDQNVNLRRVTNDDATDIENKNNKYNTNNIRNNNNNNIVIVDNKYNNKSYTADNNTKAKNHFTVPSNSQEEFKRGKSYAGNQVVKNNVFDNLLFCNRPQSLKLSIADLEHNFKPAEDKNSEASVVRITNGYMSNRIKQLTIQSKNKYEGYVIKSIDGEESINLSDEEAVINQFWLALTLANECIVEKSKNPTDKLQFEYSGMSPDDIELVKTSAKQGYELCYSDHKKKIINLGIGDSKVSQAYEVLQVLEFSSDRKRMSIIIRDAQGKIILYTKGADTIILSKLHPFNDTHILDQNIKYTSNFSKQGYRTLSVAMKVLSNNEYRIFEDKYKKASITLINRQAEIDKVTGSIEKDFYLIGSTVVEDMLQDSVPETIRDLRLAQIKIWMLTGDKIDTAYSIGLSCNLITPKMKTFIVNGEKGNSIDTLLHDFSQYISSFDLGNVNGLIRSQSIGTEKQEQIIRNFRSNSVVLKSMISASCPSESYYNAQLEDPLKKANNNFSIVIDSMALTKILGDSNSLEAFLNIALRAYAVICCRISPLQKSQIVKEVKQASTEVISLAIGDGGNDVSMILEANIGVGIYGEEGMRAVQASDFALGEFKLLRRLLLHNGRINNIRISNMILYFFYKNFILTIIHYFFGFSNNFSGQTIIDDWFIAMYNLIFTALPLCVNAIFDYDLRSSDSIIIDKLMPFLYIETRDKPILTVTSFFKKITSAIFEGAVIYFMIINSQNHRAFDENGDTPDLWYFSTNIFTIVILVVSLKLLVTTRFWTYILIAVVFATSWFTYLLALLVSNSLSLFNSQGTTSVACKATGFYLNLFLLAGICFLIDFFIHSFNLNIVMGLAEKISHDLQLIREITVNSMKKEYGVDKSSAMNLSKQKSIKNNSHFMNNSQQNVEDNNLKPFENLPFYIAEHLDHYIDYEGELHKQYEFKEDDIEPNEYAKTMMQVQNKSPKRNKKRSPKRGTQNNSENQKTNYDGEIRYGNNNYLNKELVNIQEEDKHMHQDSNSSNKNEVLSKSKTKPLKGDKKYFDSQKNLHYEYINSINKSNESNNNAQIVNNKDSADSSFDNNKNKVNTGSIDKNNNVKFSNSDQYSDIVIKNKSSKDINDNNEPPMSIFNNSIKNNNQNSNLFNNTDRTGDFIKNITNKISLSINNSKIQSQTNTNNIAKESNSKFFSLNSVNKFTSPNDIAKKSSTITPSLVNQKDAKKVNDNDQKQNSPSVKQDFSNITSNREKLSNSFEDI